MDDGHFFSDRFQYTWGPHTPTRCIETGEVLRVVCPDSDNCLADGSPLPLAQRQPTVGTSLFEGNPLAGPIYVADVTDNDCLSVTIESIELDRSNGVTLLAPAHGLLSRDELFGRHANTIQDAVPRHVYRWRLRHDLGLAEMENPLGKEALSVPLRPMIGSIGVCPSWGQSISSLFAGLYGGNMDLPLATSGATLILPVFHPGGLLMLGDIHAAQGAGEIVGGGIETSGIATIRVHKVANRPIPAPRLIANGKLFAVATEGELRNAISHAYARLVDWLALDFQLSRWDSYQLVSQAGELVVGGLVTPSCLTVAAGLAIDCLPLQCHPEIERWQGR